MFPRFIISGLLISLIGFSVALVQTLPADAARRTGKLCMTDHFHYGSSSGHRNKKIARTEAIASWAGFTAFEYGNAWASFRLARSKAVRCAREVNGWGCKVEGVPCRRVRKRSRRSR